jgi:hypothetical protein
MADSKQTPEVSQEAVKDDPDPVRYFLYCLNVGLSDAKQAKAGLWLKWPEEMSKQQRQDILDQYTGNEDYYVRVTETALFIRKNHRFVRDLLLDTASWTASVTGVLLSFAIVWFATDRIKKKL